MASKLKLKKPRVKGYSKENFLFEVIKIANLSDFRISKLSMKNSIGDLQIHASSIIT